jgi:nucleoid-associated protein YgaU
MRLVPWLVILNLFFVSCSGSKSAQSVNQDTPQVELSDADEFIENPNQEPSAEPTEAQEMSNESLQADSGTSSSLDQASAPESSESSDVMVQTNAESSASSDVSSSSMSYSGGAEKTYAVQKNETLMMIAFKLYGDYAKWRELANQNSDTLKGGTTVRAGMNLKYIAPAEEFVWSPQGVPYLIRTGDTLGIISNSVYQTTKKWKSIWNNNRPLIKDPNKIYAGFTLYYLEDGRDVASQL